MADEILKRDENHEPVMGAVTDDSSQFIKMLRIDDATKGLMVSVVGGGGTGTVTSISGSTGILLTPDPITTTGSVGLATNIAPIATLGVANQQIRVNAGATALEYFTPSAGGDVITIGTTTVANGNTTRILYNNAGVVGEYVTTSAATASAVAIRDANANIFFNNYIGNATSTVSAGGTTVLTVASSRFQALTGSSAQTFQLPDATTMSLGPWFVFNNNSSQSLTITNNGGSTIYTVPAGAIVQIGPTSIGTANGTWDVHGYTPSTTTWGTGVSGLIFNTALTTSPQIMAGASSSTVPSFIPQRGASTTGFGGDGTNLYGTIAGTAIATISSSGLGLGTNSLTLTGSIASTGSRVTKGWFTDLEVTNAIVGSITGNAATVSSANEATDTSCFPLFITASGTQTLATKNNTGFTYNSNTNDLGITKINGLTMTASTGTFTLTNAKTLAVTNTLTLSGTDSTTMTFPTTTATIARTDAGQTFTGVNNFTSPDTTTSITTSTTSFTAWAGATTLLTIGGTGASASLFAPSTLDTTSSTTGAIRTSGGISAAKALNIGTNATVAGAIINTNNAITASGNAATVPVTASMNTVTNNSAATLTITLTTSGAVDRQKCIVNVLDFSAVAQTITWVNTENSTVTAPTTSNGSTTLPLTVGFMYNNATSKWRCVASA
jgi:hypothetical protein